MDQKIILNRIQTPDGTVLTSYHVHDYVEHYDTVAKETYSTDGGTQYLHRTVNKVPATVLDVYDDEPFEVIREALHWGTRGKNGDQPLRWVVLSKMSNEHIENILINFKTSIPFHYVEFFKQELKYRKENNITIED